MLKYKIPASVILSALIPAIENEVTKAVEEELTETSSYDASVIDGLVKDLNETVAKNVMLEESIIITNDHNDSIINNLLSENSMLLESISITGDYENKVIIDLLNEISSLKLSTRNVRESYGSVLDQLEDKINDTKNLASKEIALLKAENLRLINQDNKNKKASSAKAEKLNKKIFKLAVEKIDLMEEKGLLTNANKSLRVENNNLSIMTDLSGCNILDKITETSNGVNQKEWKNLEDEIKTGKFK